MPFGDEYTGLEEMIQNNPFAMATHGAGANYQVVGGGWPPAQLIGAATTAQIIGADANGNLVKVTPVAPAPPAAAPLGSLPYGGTPTIMQENPRNVRNYPLGFFQPAVPAAATVIVTARPQVIFRPRRLVVPVGPAATPFLRLQCIPQSRHPANTWRLDSCECVASRRL